MSPIQENLNRFHLLDLKNPTHPSIFVQEGAYDMLIVALPTKEKELRIHSYAFVFEGSRYYYFDKANHTFELFETLHKVYDILNEKTNETMKIVANIHESIDWMEERLYNTAPFNAFIRDWLGHKKDLARLQRLLALGAETIEAFIERYEEREDFLMIHFKDIHEHLERTHRSVLLAGEKLNNLYTFYTSRNNEKMNRTIYLLTILSGIFLPLNLIVGYFGINTQGLPLSEFPKGSLIVAEIMLGCLVFTITLFLFLRKRF